MVFPEVGAAGGPSPTPGRERVRSPGGARPQLELRRTSAGPLRSGENCGIYIEKTNSLSSNCPSGAKMDGTTPAAALPAAAAASPLPAAEFRGNLKFRGKREKY